VYSFRKYQMPRLVQEIPHRRGSAELHGRDPIEHVVTADHDDASRSDCPARQMNERRECDHRRADGKNHSKEEMIEMDAETPRESHDREFKQHQPEPAREKKAVDLACIAALRAI